MWYYVKNGSTVGGLMNIGGKLYGFYDDGSLVKNGIVEDWRSDYVSGYYFCGSDGTVSATAGWKTDSQGYKYYTDANGRCLTGIRSIGGKTYYFTGTGRLLP